MGNFFSSGSNPLKILFVASESAPYAQVGGLGEVMKSLPKALRDLGHDARVFVPKYAATDIEKYPLEKEITNLAITSKEKDPFGLLVCNVLSLKDEKGRKIVYFLENMEYYEKRANVYGYNDDTTRWLLLSRGAVEFIKKSDWKPDVVVGSDWQAGFVSNIIETEFKGDPILSKIATVYSIHNLRHQGMFDVHFVSEIDYDSGQGVIPEFFNPEISKLNGARRGILYSDVINTVSPTYAKEILSPENGEKLDEVLKLRRDRLYGILNGIDYENYSPENPDKIKATFSADNLKNRVKNKKALQQRTGLAEDKDKFIISYVGRLDGQKGIDLIRETAESLFQNLDFQMIIVGTGENDYKFFFQELQKKYPDRVSASLTFNPDLPQLVYSGSDCLLVPSVFEPCGLIQMEAMRYGTIPIVRKVGGLADSVIDYNQKTANEGTGFVFEKYDHYAFLIAIVRAYETYRNKKEWSALVKRTMNVDFSWQKSAKEYLALFETAIKIHNEPNQ